MRTRWASLLLTIVLMGCSGSEPTLDATSEATTRASVNAMTGALPTEQKKDFVRVLLRASLKGARNGDGLKPWHGMTANQILEADKKPK
jgi:hypothetical protein